MFAERDPDSFTRAAKALRSEARGVNSPENHIAI